MLTSTDKQDTFTKPLSMLTPLEHDLLYYKNHLEIGIARIEKEYNVKIKTITIKDGVVDLEWEEMT